MSTDAARKPPAPSREADIDFAKGLACVLMAYGHVGFQVGVPSFRAPMFYPLVIVGELSVALFFMATGLNVWHYVKANASKTDFGPTRAYLVTNVALAGLAVAYNLNRMSVGLMDIFQGIAAAALLTYIPLRRGWPAWSIIAIALLLFGIAFGYTVTPPDIAHGHITVSSLEFQRGLRPDYPHGDLMARYLAFLADLTALPIWDRFLFVHFSVLPWAGFALVGGVIARDAAKPKVTAALAALFFVSFAASFFVPFFIERNLIDFYFRGKGDYVLRYLGAAGLLFLGLRWWYRGRSRAARWFELIGRESFLFFISHWLFMEILVIFFNRPIMMFPVLAAVLALVTVTVKRLAARRDAGANDPAYARRWGITLATFSLASGLLHYGASWPGNANVHVAHWLSFPASFAFAMFFPALRGVLRGKRPPRPAPLTEAAR
ncbi:acyltransferase [bacterium]|nr:acyltransferase [bacterium]